MNKEKKIDEKIRKKLWKEFSKKIQYQLHKIVSPVTTTKDRSYQTLVDVISNIILFENNIDKKPWDLIPQRKIEKLNEDEIIKEALKRASRKEIARELLNRLYEWDGYLDGITGDDLIEDYEKFGWLQIAIILGRLIKKN